MRFLIQTESYCEEVIGESVVIEQLPDEIFAVHRAHIGASGLMPYWTVSHKETGFAVSHGDTIDFAIQIAREKFASKTLAEIHAALAKARAKLSEMAKKPVMQGNPGDLLIYEDKVDWSQSEAQP